MEKYYKNIFVNTKLSSVTRVHVVRTPNARLLEECRLVRVCQTFMGTRWTVVGINASMMMNAVVWRVVKIFTANRRAHNAVKMHIADTCKTIRQFVNVHRYSVFRIMIGIEKENNIYFCFHNKGFIGSPLRECRPECNTNQECPNGRPLCRNGVCLNPCNGACGADAECSIKGSQTICSCPPNTTGNPYHRCRPFTRGTI